jgi:hypothetical protein
MSDATGMWILGVLFGSAGLLFYFVPTLVARGKNRFSSILVLNIFLGWTVIGWVGALIWAMNEKKVQANTASA